MQEMLVAVTGCPCKTESMIVFRGLNVAIFYNNNNKHFFNLQVVNSPSRLRFEANLSRESSECTEHSQDQTSQINTGKTVYVGNA